MARKAKPNPRLPVVPWQGNPGKAYRLIQLADLRGRKPADGHDPGSPHRIGFHALLLITEGGFDHWLDFETHRLSRNHLVYIAYNQIHHFMEKDKPFRAWALIFRPELFHELAQPIADGWSFMGYLWPSITRLRPKETSLLDRHLELLARLEHEHPKQHTSAARYHACCIITLAFELATLRHPQAANLQTNERFLNFAKLVERSFATRRDVQWYAQQLSCSERTLTRVCQDAVGKPAKAFLQDRVVTEAKRVLSYRDDSVSAIAELLGFRETTNFIRFFKNSIGMTPESFRTLNRGGAKPQ